MKILRALELQLDECEKLLANDAERRRTDFFEADYEPEEDLNEDALQVIKQEWKESPPIEMIDAGLSRASREVKLVLFVAQGVFGVTERKHDGTYDTTRADSEWIADALEKEAEELIAIFDDDPDAKEKIEHWVQSGRNIRDALQKKLWQTYVREGPGIPQGKFLGFFLGGHAQVPQGASHRRHTCHDTQHARNAQELGGR